MSKDREHKISENFVLYDYCLPDGLICQWVYPRHQVGYDEFLSTAKLLVQMSLLTGREIRLCGEVDLVNRAGEELRDEAARQDIEIIWGKNRFFEYSLRDEERAEILKWKNYENFFSIAQVFPEDGDNFELVRILMLGSFGTTGEKIRKIKDALPLAMRDIKNNIYLVLDKKNDKAVGVFVTKYLPELEEGEVQLHSVAGRSNDARVLQIPNKLPILMAALLTTIDDHYPLGEYYGIGNQSYLPFQGAGKLTFSASAEGLLLSYKKLGFEFSNIAGLVFKPFMQL
ncbi:hypothetical protein HYT59_00995 [Candidatus Woesebacteria bacterium]|nr:hypothetical protein [Candidatus Woesebacteria bacterium]